MINVPSYRLCKRYSHKKLNAWRKAHGYTRPQLAAMWGMSINIVCSLCCKVERKRGVGAERFWQIVRLTGLDPLDLVELEPGEGYEPALEQGRPLPGMRKEQ